MAHARGVRREALVVGELGAPARLDELAELAVVADRDDDPAVARLERLVRHDVRMCVAPAHGRLAAREEVRVHVREERHLHVEERHVDVLAFARAVAVRERGEDRDRRVQARREIGDRDARLLRAAARQAVALAGDAHEAAHPLDDEVVAGAVRVRARLAEARHRAIDEAGLHGRERRVVEPVFRELADLVVLEHDVALRGELADDPLALGRRDIDRHRALVAVRGEVVRGFAGVGAVRRLQVRRAPVPGVVAALRALDLDHVGAEIGKRLRAPRAREHAAQVQDADVAEGSHLRSVSSVGCAFRVGAPFAARPRGRVFGESSPAAS